MENIQYDLTELNRMMAFLESQTDENSEEHRIFSSYIELQKKRFLEDKNTERPFLSIITRTQGKRPDMLTETLLCLTGQTDIDFEFILAGHNLNEEQKKSVTSMIEELPEWMQKRTVFLPVDGGTRTTPLIKGFEAARGRYVAVLDDDDIVFDNWVASFRNAAERAPGKILHSYVLYQDWETVSDELPNTPISVDAYNTVFCTDFFLIDELTRNYCPLMSLAFPSYAFKVLNVRFDEELTTTEDWDFLMRMAFICGVENEKAVTSVYRNWLNTENSQTLHKKEEWNQNYEKIVERFKTIPSFFDEYSIQRLINRWANPNSAVFINDNVKLYYDCGHGFSEAHTLTAINVDSEDWTNKFINMSELDELSAIRIDPLEQGNILLDNLRIKVCFSDGTEKVYLNNEFFTNSYDYNGRYVFLKNDPQMVIHFDEPKRVDSVLCNLEITNPVPDDIVDALVGVKGIRSTYIYRFLQKVWRKLKRIVLK